MHYAPKAKLCTKEPITHFFTRSHNRIILVGLIYTTKYDDTNNNFQWLNEAMLLVSIGSTKIKKSYKSQYR